MQHKNEVLKPHRRGKINFLPKAIVNEITIPVTVYATNTNTTNTGTTTIASRGNECNGAKLNVS